MKDKIFRLTKWFICCIAMLSLAFALNIGAYAEESQPEDTNTESVERVDTDSESVDTDVKDIEPGKNEGEDLSVNVFDEIYGSMEANADKIFSILAFVGTLIVGVGYKSGLLPLLRDALSKLKSAIDGVKADGESSKALTEMKMAEISSAIDDINTAIEKNNGELERIEWQFESYEQLMAERRAMRAIIEGQIDMLYAIFMSSALPQYQKDEIGTRINAMREELSSYEEKVEK